ncbi:transcription termination factor Rho [Saccharothrix saharensis]|uniref:Transcription termination factor Rho n=1 Tax=Saccharothrix saharensis TaxID=571190 RepID=A0A543JQ52_9PSEU|nr:transcription termination factor Rho [Saccharothrix saharensis]
MTHHDITHTRLVSGVLDAVDRRTVLRAGGYLPGPRDVTVTPRLVAEHGLRRGDEVHGRAAPAPREDGPPALVTVEAVNGAHPRHSPARPAFADLVPTHPQERLRLETEPHELTTRVVDLLMPIGKGQRALVVAPPKAGKTTVLRSIAHGIAKNHPECHLMLVLVGERPEEVTDLARAVPAEVVAATFDHPPRDHTALAELAVERAKRLVELGRDVVVLLDSATRLGRAYNLAAPTGGRTLSGGVDAGALTAPKRFLGAARNVEGGGSLTVIATALVETGSAGDTLLFEEYKGTGNAELRLDRRSAARRVFPAVDVHQSGTRREDLLLTPGEAVATRLLRRVLAGQEDALDVLLDGLRKTNDNAEFLTRLRGTTPR